MRLIDADELKKNYTASFVNAFGMEEAEMFVGVINQMPTAYDIDKLVEQLEEESWSVGCSFAPKENRTAIIKTEKAIEIVKGGAK